MHFQEHNKISAIVAAKTNTQQFVPVIWPVVGTFSQRQAEQHQILHQQMNALSGSPTSDMTKLNFNDPEQFEAFVYENFKDHQAFDLLVGV